MGARSKARKRALDVLFQADVVGADVRETLQQRLAMDQPVIPAYAVELVEGVIAHRARLDEIIERFAEDWTIDRMPAVDRGVLRLATFEVLYRDDVPDAVAISEAVELVRSLSTDESPRFVNGLLATVAAMKAELLRDEAAAHRPDLTAADQDAADDR